MSYPNFNPFFYTQQDIRSHQFTNSPLSFKIVLLEGIEAKTINRRCRMPEF